MNSFKSHKLDYYPEKIIDIIKGKIPNPVQCEISLTNACNFKCPWCVFSYTSHKITDKLSLSNIKNIANDLQKLDVKSVVFAGIGEPFMYSQINEAIKLIAEKNIKIGITTNGSLISNKNIPSIINYCSWIRFSINTPNNNGVKKDYTNKIFNIISEINSQKNNNLKIGVQSILIDKNINGYKKIIEKSDKSGVDYYMLRPFYTNQNNSQNVCDKYTLLLKDKIDIYKELSKIKTKKLKVFLRKETEELRQVRNYNICYALPFIFTIDGDGSVYNCFPERNPTSAFCIGNINKDRLIKIWWGKKHIQFLQNIMPNIDKSKCQEYCRHHAGNEYLNDIIHNREESVWV